MLGKGLLFAILFIGISVTTFHTAQGNQFTEITVTIIGDPVIVLNSPKNMIRANVEIENYDPRDGYYFMKVVDTSSGQVLRESEVLPKPAVNDIWGVQIAYLPQHNEIEIGEYEIQIITEFGSATGKTSFSVTDIMSPDSQEIVSTEKVVEQSPESEPTSSPPESTPEPVTELSPEQTPKIPNWVRNFFILYAEERISEDELLNAIQFLIDHGILKK